MHQDRHQKNIRGPYNYSSNGTQPIEAGLHTHKKRYDREDRDYVMRSTRAYHDEYADEYVEFCQRWARREGVFADRHYREGYETVARTLSDTATPGEQVADVGCGIGRWSELLARMCVRVVSLDPSPRMIRKVAQKCQQGQIPSEVWPVLADGFYIPFRDRAFDGAILNWVLAHIPVVSNDRFMREVARVVRLDGWLFVSDGYWRGQEGGKEQIQLREVGSRTHEVYKYYYEPEELRRLVEGTFGRVESLLPLHYELICVARRLKV